MTGVTESRMQEIRRRTQCLRRRYARRARAWLTACSLMLLGGMGALLRHAQAPGISTVTRGYGSVLLRSDAGLYVVVGVIAFSAGAALTVLCIRYREKQLRSERK